MGAASLGEQAGSSAAGRSEAPPHQPRFAGAHANLLKRLGDAHSVVLLAQEVGAPQARLLAQPRQQVRERDVWQLPGKHLRAQRDLPSAPCQCSFLQLSPLKQTSKTKYWTAQPMATNVTVANELRAQAPKG